MLNDRDGWRVRRKALGMGGFLCPPGHPDHTHAVRNNRSGAMMSVTDAATHRGLPRDVREAAQKLLDAAELRCSPLWVRFIYGWQRGMWTPTGTMWESTKELTTRVGPTGRHAAVVFIRQFFPDHRPDSALIVDPGRVFGEQTCRKCGDQVQYDPGVDGFKRHGHTTPDCRQGGQHSIEKDS